MNSNITLILIIISSIIHPLWNLLLKKSTDKVIFYFNIHLFFTVFFSFVLFVYPVNSISKAGWIFVILSSLAHFFYQVFLCKSYEIGDLSLTYPIIRSAPLFVVIAGLLFLKEGISFTALIAIILIVLGAQMINHRSLALREFLDSWRYLNKKAMLAAILTAVFSALYSVVDKKGVLELSPVLFFYLFFAISGLMFGGYLLFLKGRADKYWEITKKDKYRIAAASLMEFASYILILYSFRVAKVATVIAIRQASVVFGALFGIWFLRESYGKVRILASLIIFLGIYLLVVFK